MAGIKITELPPIGTLEKTDLTYVVDSSNDTSKQATIQNVIDAVDKIEFTDENGTTKINITNSGSILIETTNPSFSGIRYAEPFPISNYSGQTLITRADAPYIYRAAFAPSFYEPNFQLGDIWVYESNNAYIAINTGEGLETFLNLTNYDAGTYTPSLVNIDPSVSVTFNEAIWVRTKKCYNVKGIINVLFDNSAIGHSSNFLMTLPNATGIQFFSSQALIGSIVPWGTNILNHQVNHTRIMATLNGDSAEIYIEVDNNQNGIKQFAYDFSYFIP